MMTDKQIIIDGCDVSGCEYFSSGLGYCIIGLLANDGTHICECEQNCHYKQLKRKEQECEELKEEKQGLIKDWEEKKNLAYEIACKNEKLDTENKRLVAELANPVFDSFEELDKLKQTLTEIKEIITNFYETGFLRTDNGCILINNNTCVETLNKILQKISEVEDETTK